MNKTLIILFGLVLTGCGIEERPVEKLDFLDHQFVSLDRQLRLEDQLDKFAEGRSYAAHLYRVDGRAGDSTGELTFIKHGGSVVCLGGRGLAERPRLEVTNADGTVIQSFELVPSVAEYPLLLAGESGGLRVLVRDEAHCSFALNFEVRS